MKQRLSRLAVMLLALLIALSTVGCTPPDRDPVIVEPDDFENYREIEMWIGGTQWKGDNDIMLRSFLDDFNDGLLGDAAKALNMKVNYNYMADISAIELSTAIEHKNTNPNLVIWDRFETPTAANSGYLEAVDPFFTAEELALIAPAAMNEMKYHYRETQETKQYFGMPIDVDPWGVYINLDAVQTHNSSRDPGDGEYIDIETELTETWTWKDYYEVSKKLVAGGRRVTNGDLEQHLFKFMVSTGSDLVTIEGDQITVNTDSDEIQDVLRFCRDLANDMTQVSNPEPGQFITGQIALYNSPTYLEGLIKMINPNFTNYKFLPWPRYVKNWKSQTPTEMPGAVNGGMIGGFALVTPYLRNVAHRQEADTFFPDKSFYNMQTARTMAFMKWWTIGEGAEHWAKKTQTLPALTSLYEKEGVITSPVIQAASRYVGDYKARPSVVGFLEYQVQTINTQVISWIGSTGTSTDLENILNSLRSQAEWNLQINIF